MGYMGFGMRKEVYKRKPKEAFKRLKKANTSAPEAPSQSGYDASKAYQQMRFKPAYKRLWFWVILTLTLAGATYLYLEDTVYSEIRLQEQISQFEEQGIVELYQRDKMALDSLVDFIKQREGKIARIDGSLNNGLIFGLRSANYHTSVKGKPAEDHHKYRGQSINEILEPEVVDGKLIYHINDYRRVFDDYWSYNLYVEYTRDVNTTFLTHIDAESATLDSIFRKASKVGYDVREIEYGVIAKFKNLEKEYLFVFTGNPDSLRAKSKLNPIADDVFWAEYTYYWRNLN